MEEQKRTLIKVSSVEEFDEIMNNTDLSGRDNFYTHLIVQEIPGWVNSIGKTGEPLEAVEYEWLVPRRGFNEDELAKLKWLFDFFNMNVEVISKMYRDEFKEQEKIDLPNSKEKESNVKEEKIEAFKKDLSMVINKYSFENGSNTPDFILADYLYSCLISFNRASNARGDWYDQPLES
jgi:hypothetical protein